MTQPPWDRQAVVSELRDRIWLHLTPASTGAGVLLDAAALLRLPHDDVTRLADLHLLLHPAVGALLDAAPSLLRRLGSTTTRVTEAGLAGVRGPVDWPATARLRLQTRTPAVVTHPGVRDNDIPANRLLALLLTAVRDRADSLGFQNGQPGTAGKIVADRGRRASQLAAHRALRGVTPSAPTARDLQALGHTRFARRNGPLLDAWHAYDGLVHRGDPDAVRRAVEQQGLAVAADGALFEVLVLFRLRDALAAQGWHLDPLRLFEGRLLFRGARGPDRLACHCQGTPVALTAQNAYVAAQQAHNLPNAQDLRPDLVLRFEPAGLPARWLLVEAKTSTTGKARSVLARRALHDLLAYRWAYDSQLRGQEAWGLGVVWGNGLATAEHDVQLCTPDHLPGAAARLLS